MRGVSATRNFLVIFRCYDLVLFLYSTELYRSTEGPGPRWELALSLEERLERDVAVKTN
jgi:hypothetical protein